MQKSLFITFMIITSFLNVNYIYANENYKKSLGTHFAYWKGYSSAMAAKDYISEQESFDSSLFLQGVKDYPDHIDNTKTKYDTYNIGIELAKEAQNKEDNGSISSYEFNSFMQGLRDGASNSQALSAEEIKNNLNKTHNQLRLDNEKRKNYQFKTRCGKYLNELMNSNDDSYTTIAAAGIIMTYPMAAIFKEMCPANTYGIQIYNNYPFNIDNSLKPILNNCSLSDSMEWVKQQKEYYQLESMNIQNPVDKAQICQFLSISMVEAGAGYYTY